MLQTFDAKYLNEFKANFVVLTIFLKKSVSDLNYSLILIILLERFSFALNSSMAEF